MTQTHGELTQKLRTTTSPSRRCGECGEQIAPKQDFCSGQCAAMWWLGKGKKRLENADNALNESIRRTRQTA